MDNKTIIRLVCMLWALFGGLAVLLTSKLDDFFNARAERLSFMSGKALRIFTGLIGVIIGLSGLISLIMGWDVWRD